MAGVSVAFTGFIAAFVVASVAPVVAQQTSEPPAVIRFSSGALFEVPAGWLWSEFDTRASVDIDYDKTRTNSQPKGNPNKLAVQLGRTDEAESWTRVDLSRSQTLPNGVVARWKSGSRWNIHSWFEGFATSGSKTIKVLASGGLPAKYDSAALEAALLKIAGSMREVPQSNTIFHPSSRMKIDRPDPKRWVFETNPYNIQLACMVCGKGSNLTMLVSSGPEATVSTAIATIKKHYNLKTAEERRESFPGGQVIWTERSGGRYAFLGTIKQGDDHFLISINGDKNVGASNDDLRGDFLAVARSVRTWDGR